MDISVGCYVEVCSNDDGLPTGCMAKVISTFKNKNDTYTLWEPLSATPSLTWGVGPRCGDYTPCERRCGCEWLLGSVCIAVVSRMGKKKFKVEYTTLLKENQKGPLNEVVMRPVPPEIRVSSFNVLDKMDAYILDGWWMGRVTGRKDGLKYIVHFECSGDDYDYLASDLRVHQEYNGQWVPSQ